MITTIELRNKYDTSRMWEIVGIERGPRPSLIVRMGFVNYSFDLIANQLVYRYGNRVIKRYSWYARDINAAMVIYEKMLLDKSITTC